MKSEKTDHVDYRSNELLSKAANCVWHMSIAVKSFKAHYPGEDKRLSQMIDVMASFSGHMGDDASTGVLVDCLRSENVLGAFRGYEHVIFSFKAYSELLCSESNLGVNYGMDDFISFESHRPTLNEFRKQGFEFGFLKVEEIKTGLFKSSKVEVVSDQ